MKSVFIRLFDRHAAVDKQILPCDVGRVLRAQESNRTGNLVGRRAESHRNLGKHRFAVFLVGKRLSVAVGRYYARRDAP